MSVTHLGIVWNPSKCEREDLEAALEAAMVSAAVRPMVTWAETEEDDPGAAAAETLAGADVDLIVAAGGDGTVRAVAEYLGESHAAIELGIAPVGTGNLLARNLDIPVNDLEAAFVRALMETAKPLDLGWAELDTYEGTRRYAFTVMAGFGIDAHMITETDDDLKERAGWMAYVESLGRAISASDVITVRLEIDQQPPREERLHTLIIGNCGTLPAGLALLPDADPRDGQLDVLALDAEGLGGWVSTIGSMIWQNGIGRLFGGKNESQSRAQAADEAGSADEAGTAAEAGTGAEGGVTSLPARARSLEIQLDEPRVFEVDGDDVGEVTHVSVTTQASAIRVR